MRFNWFASASASAFAMKRLAMISAALLATAAQAQSVGAPKLDLPGAVWCDKDGDGQVDCYVHEGRIYAYAPTMSGPAMSAPTDSNIARKWGALANISGSSWQSENGTEILSFTWDDPGHVLSLRYHIANGYYVKHIVFRLSDDGRFMITDNGSRSASSVLLPDGSIFFAPSKDALIPIDVNTFEWANGRLKDGLFVRSAKQEKVGGLNWSNGRFTRMSSVEAKGFVKVRQSYKLAEDEKKRQEIERRASSGNSGVLGGLLMGGMAAAMGGDAGVVMGAAMKGVEMTTDNEMSRNVLAGQGDAMIQSSIDTKNMIAETERLRVAAEEETRLRSEAAAAGRTYTPPAPARPSGSSGLASAGKSGPASAAAPASKRPGYYACNSYNVRTRVSYYSPIIVRPYDERWERRLEQSFAAHTARYFPGEYHGGGASCWSRLSQTDTEASIADSKRSATMYGDKTTANVVDWAPPQ